MNFPLELKSIIENICSKYKDSELKESANSISNIYMEGNNNGQSLVNKEKDILAYAVMRMPATFSAVSSVLDEISKLSNIEAKTILDVGSGMGTASLAMLYHFDNEIEVTCLEREEEMISLGKKIFSNYPGLSSTKWIDEDYREYMPEEKYDIVIASYTLNELSMLDRARVVNELWNRTNKLLIIVEPGTPVAFKEIKWIRDELISKGGYLLVPCSHMDKCPIEDDDWCHFATRVERSRLHKYLKGGDSPYEDEKYSYLVFSKEKVEPKISYRILRHPLIGKGNISLVACGKNGIENLRIFKNNPDFKKIKKLKCGDSF